MMLNNIAPFKKFHLVSAEQNKGEKALLSMQVNLTESDLYYAH